VGCREAASSNVGSRTPALPLYARFDGVHKGLVSRWCRRETTQRRVPGTPGRRSRVLDAPPSESDKS